MYIIRCVASRTDDTGVGIPVQNAATSLESVIASAKSQLHNPFWPNVIGFIIFDDHGTEVHRWYVD